MSADGSRTTLRMLRLQYASCTNRIRRIPDVSAALSRKMRSASIAPAAIAALDAA